MTDTITVTGLVATAPRHIVTNEGLAITSFRLASAQRRFDRTHQRWIDADTNWYTVTTFRQLAINAAGSIAKGDRLVVSGRLRIREWENGERTGTTIDIEADAVGHDLAWGTSTFSRSISSTLAAGESGAGESGAGDSATGESGVGESSAGELGSEPSASGGRQSQNAPGANQPSEPAVDEALAALPF